MKRYVLAYAMIAIAAAIVIGQANSAEGARANAPEITEPEYIAYTADKSQNRIAEPPITECYAGEFILTAYCPCAECCGKTDGITATGTMATAGRTLGVDHDVIPLGSTVYINGHAYVAEDTGAFTGHVIDIYMDSHQAALEFGRQQAEVIWIP